MLAKSLEKEKQEWEFQHRRELELKELAVETDMTRELVEEVRGRYQQGASWLEASWTRNRQ